MQRHVTVLFAAVTALHGFASTPHSQRDACDSRNNLVDRTLVASIHGDVFVMRDVVEFTMDEAIVRHDLQGLFDQLDYDRAREDLYRFFKWKLGSPSLAAAQYVSKGCPHFAKSYDDEAAAMLLGVLEIEEGEPIVIVPPIYKLYEELFPEFFAKHVGFQIPKHFDIPDAALEELIAGRREIDAASGASNFTPMNMDDFRRLPTNDGDLLTTVAKLEERIAELEAALARIEGNVARLAPAPVRPDPGLTKAKPARKGYEIVRNPELVGRMGRLVVEYPAEVEVGTWFAIHALEEGKLRQLHNFYGAGSTTLMPGTYSVELASLRRAGILIESGCDTILDVGSLTIQLADGTYWEVLDGADQRLADGYGAGIVGLLPGTYAVRVTGMKEEVVIEAGTLTKF